VKRQPTQYSHKVQWQKIVISTIFNYKLLEYIKLPKILLSKCLVFVEDEWHLTLSISWKIDYERGSTHTWMIAPNFTIYVFLLGRIFVWTSPCQVAYQSSILCIGRKCMLLVVCKMKIRGHNFNLLTIDMKLDFCCFQFWNFWLMVGQVATCRSIIASNFGEY
jgi:hypothetical protein